MFTPDIFPISQPNINWHAFLQGTVAATGESPTRPVDGYPGNLSDFARFLASLAHFNAPNLQKDVLATIRDSRSLLGHLSFGFLVSAEVDVFCQIGQRTKLIVTSSPRDIAIVTGSLADWRGATLEFLWNTECDFAVRLLFDKIILYFEHIGLGDIWFGYRKQSLKDQTFLLEYRP